MPKGLNVSNLEHTEKTNPRSQVPSVHQYPTYKKVFIFDSSSNIRRQSEHSIVSSSTNIEANIQCSTVTPNVFPESEHGIFKKPSSTSIRRKISSRPLSRKTWAEDGKKKIISASYSSGEDLPHRDYTDPLRTQEGIINNTFDKPLQTGDQNVDLKIATSSVQDLIINDTYSATEEMSRKYCQSEEAFHFQSNENSALHSFIEKEIISDSSDNHGDLNTQVNLKNKNEIFKPTMNSNVAELKKGHSLGHEKSKSSSQLHKPDNESEIIKDCNKNEEIYELSCLFEEVMTLKQKHNKNNIFKKMLTAAEDFGPTSDPKATLDLARKLRSTFALQYNQMVRKLSGDLMEHNDAWEEFECKMRQPVEMLLQVESVLPQVIQASSAERRLNADSEYKEYLKNISHDFTPEDLEEVNPHQIFCDNENAIEEIAARFRQQLKDTGCFHDPVNRLDNDLKFSGDRKDAQLELK
nr:unnamed protein product [Callosobruchus analis]